MNRPIPSVVSETIRQLQKYFGYNPKLINTLPELEQQLLKEISHLLRSDLNRLLHILYRIDVEELLVKKIMALATPEKQIAEELARIIIKRELQKVQTRFRYQQN